MLLSADLCSATDSPTINVAIIYIVVDIITAAVPANIGINTAVKPAVRLVLTKYRIIVTTRLTTLRTYTIKPEMNFIRLVEVQIMSKIKTAITAQHQIEYKIFDHNGKARLIINNNANAAIIIAIPNSV